MATDQALNIIATSINRRRPNKPMVPTAPTQPDEHPLASLRRHIGRPLGGRQEHQR
jgi:hypothetical protein